MVDDAIVVCVYALEECSHSPNLLAVLAESVFECEVLKVGRGDVPFLDVVLLSSAHHNINDISLVAADEEDFLTLVE